MISAYFLLAATVYTVTSAASISSNDGKNKHGYCLTLPLMIIRETSPIKNVQRSTISHMRIQIVDRSRGKI